MAIETTGTGPGGLNLAYQPPPNGFRTFLIVWITQSVSVFGSALTFFTVNIWLTQSLYPLPEQKAQLAFALSAIGLAFGLPTVFGAPLAGAWADRHDRKRTMIAADFISALLSLALVGAFHSAAFDTSYAMIVPEEQLPRANGMMQSIWSLSGILSPMIAAAIISLPALARQGVLAGRLAAPLSRLENGAPLAIGIDALTFFVAALVPIFLFIPSPKRTDLGGDDGQARKSVWADILEGGRFIWRRRPLLWLLGTFAVANFAGAPVGVFQPLLVKFNLAADWAARGFSFETALALLASLAGLGGVAGGLFISAWGGLKYRRVYGVIVPLIVSGIAVSLYGLSPLLYLSGAMVFLESATVPLMNSHSQTIWQTQTPRELQGRVFAVRRLIAQFTWPLSTALAGWLGGAFNPGAVLAVLGAFLTVFCLAQLFNPYLLRVEDNLQRADLAAG